MLAHNRGRIANDVATSENFPDAEKSKNMPCNIQPLKYLAFELKRPRIRMLRIVTENLSECQLLGIGKLGLHRFELFGEFFNGFSEISESS